MSELSSNRLPKPKEPLSKFYNNEPRSVRRTRDDLRPFEVAQLKEDIRQTAQKMLREYDVDPHYALGQAQRVHNFIPWEDGLSELRAWYKENVDSNYEF